MVKKCWGILQIVFHRTLETTSKALAHQNSAFGAGKWSLKPYSMFPPLWDPKVIVAGTLKHTFWNYSNLNSAWSISESTLLKLLQLNVHWHGPITHAHSMTCHRTSFNMQLVPYPKLYFPETSTLEGPQHIGPSPWCHMFHPFTSSSSPPPPAYPESISFWNYLNLTWVIQLHMRIQPLSHMSSS